MANFINTVEAAKSLVLNINTVRAFHSSVELTQNSEGNRVTLEYHVPVEQPALVFMIGQEIKILGMAKVSGVETFKFQIVLEIEEDWALEEDLLGVFGKFGYRTPTQIRFGKVV